MTDINFILSEIKVNVSGLKTLKFRDRQNGFKNNVIQ